MKKDLFKRTFQIKESQCTVITDKQAAIKTAEETIKNHRSQLEKYINKNPKFLYTLKPLPPPQKPLVARLMAEAAQKANVGPMAAVAGVLADLAVKEMIKEGCKVAAIENGGEISAISNRPIDVALAAGDDPLSKKFGFRLTNFPIGLATSSGRFSRALSFGDAEAATVFCQNAGLADAAATAVGNVVKGENHQQAIEQAISKALSIPGVEGVLILYQALVGTAGKIPQIIRVNPENEGN
jgi:uncharacterized protein